MSLLDQRLFIFFDEWLWLALCLYLLHRWTERMGVDAADEDERRTWKYAFLATLAVGAVMIYGIGYPAFLGWWRP